MKTHSRSQDVAARIGGDEFILFLPGFTREDLLRERAGAICASFRSGGAKYDKVPLSVSVGIAVSDGNTNFDQLFKKADERLYEAKKQGKGLAL